MKAIIMAGGEGKRLRPITCTVPKPMVPLLNKPIIDYSLELLKKHGFSEAVITVHYLAKVILEHIGNGQSFGLSVTYSDPGLKLGTAGSMKFALCGAREPVLVLSGDGITDIDLSELVAAHRKSGADATIVLKSVDEPTEYGVALTDRSGMITRFIEKPEKNELFSDYANTGIYIIEPSAIELIADGADFDFSKDLFPLMLEKGMKLFGYKTEAYWCDIGNVSEYRRAQYDMLDGKLQFASVAETVDDCLVESGAQISPESVLIPPCYIGKGAVIGDGAIVGPHAVVCSGAVIGREATLKRSIVFSGSIVRSSAELRETVVCENAQIGSAVRLYGETVIGAGSIIESDSCVYPNAKIWPDKTVPAGTDCYENIVWGNVKKGPSFEDSVISGYGDTELTPETSVRIGSAIASVVGNDAAIALCSDGKPSSVMIRSALAAGINSQGADTYLLSRTSLDCFLYTVQSSGYDAGAYIHADGERNLRIELIDAEGLPIQGKVLRAVRQAFDEGESKPAVSAELGIQAKCEGFEYAYERHLSKFVSERGRKVIKPTLFLEASETSYQIIERILTRSGWNVLRGAGRSSALNANEISVKVDPSGTFDLITSRAEAGDHAVKAVLIKKRAETCHSEKVVMPSTICGEYRKLLKLPGTEIVYSKEDRASLMRASRQASASIEELYNSEAAVIAVCDLFAAGELENELLALPKESRFERTAEVASCDRGRLLRKLSESESGDTNAELIDGYRLTFDAGWVEIRPEAGSRSAFKVAAGSMNSEYAEELCDVYLKKLIAIRDGKKE